MIQIVCCSCTQGNVIDDQVDIYVENKFYRNRDKIFVVPCARQPSFKERISSCFTNIACSCEKLEKGRHNNCKVICFNINLLADKIKTGHYFDKPSTVEIIPIEKYLMKLKVCFFYCRDCFKVQCSLDHPYFITLIKTKKPYGHDLYFFCRVINMYKIVTCNCKRYRLAQLDINHTYSFLFDDCLCFTDHEVVVVKCKIYPYNLVGFARNYFASVSCSCVKLDKDTACHHCINLRSSLNSETIKICLKIKISQRNLN